MQCYWFWKIGRTLSQLPSYVWQLVHFDLKRQDFYFHYHYLYKLLHFELNIPNNMNSPSLYAQGSDGEGTLLTGFHEEGVKVLISRSPVSPVNFLVK